MAKSRRKTKSGVPYSPPERPSFFGSAKGTVLQYDRPFDSIDGDYDIDHDER